MIYPLNIILLTKYIKLLNLHSLQNKKRKCNEIFSCSKCKRIFHSFENLNKHLKSKINCENQLFECNKCKKTFTTNKNLLKHIKNIKCYLL